MSADSFDPTRLLDATRELAAVRDLVRATLDRAEALDIFEHARRGAAGWLIELAVSDEVDLRQCLAELDDWLYEALTVLGPDIEDDYELRAVLDRVLEDRGEL